MKNDIVAQDAIINWDDPFGPEYEIVGIKAEGRLAWPPQPWETIWEFNSEKLLGFKKSVSTDE